MYEERVIIMQDGRPLYEPSDITFVDIEQDDMYCPGCGRCDCTIRLPDEKQLDLIDQDYELHKLRCTHCGLNFYLQVRKEEVV